MGECTELVYCVFSGLCFTISCFNNRKSSGFMKNNPLKEQKNLREAWCKALVKLCIDNNAYFLCTYTRTWIKKARLQCWPWRGRQVLHQRSIWEIHCRQDRKCASEVSTQHLPFGKFSSEVQNRGIKGPHKKTDATQEFLKSNGYFL